MSEAARIVMIYVEPTHYVRGLVEACRAAHPGPIEVYYIAEDLSQDWSIELDASREQVLPGSPVAALRRIWTALRPDRRPTVLHLAGWGHRLLFAALLLARLRAVPAVVESDSWKSGATGRAAGLVKAALYPRLLALPAHFLPGGTRQAAYLAGYGVPPQRMTHAQMTVDVAAMRDYARLHGASARAERRAHLGIDEAAVTFLFVGRLEAAKGLASLLAAFGDVNHTHPEARLVIVGDGTLRAEVAAAAAANPAIVPTGRLSGGELWATFCAADVMVLPSEFEPWGLVVNEAMAFGLPVIVSDEVGCASDLVADGQQGFVVPAGDRGRLAAALSAFAAGGDLLRRCAEGARVRIHDWTLQNEAQTLVRVWRNC